MKILKILKNSKIYYHIFCTNGTNTKRTFIHIYSKRKRERGGGGEGNRTMHDIALSIFALQITNNRLARTSISAKMTVRFCFRKL